MPNLETQGASLYYETNGEKGPWITLVNGHTRSSRDFRLLSKSLVTAGYQCLSFDNRGSGQSVSSREFTAMDMVQDIYALWDKFGIRSSFVLGISMGGMLSQIVAAERSASIPGLILVSTGASERDLNPLSFGSWGTTPEDVSRRMNHYFTPEFAARNKLLVDAMVKQILQAVLNEDFEAKATAQRLAVQGLDNSARLAQITCPTLILHGERDEIIRVEAAYEMAKLIKKSELRILEGKGHLLLAEDSKKLSEEIVTFCNRWRS